MNQGFLIFLIATNSKLETRFHLHTSNVNGTVS